MRLPDASCGQVVAVQGSRLRVKIHGSESVLWREYSKATPMFGGTPKDTAAVGDFAKLGQAVCVITSVDGRKVQIEMVEDGKKVWRQTRDLLLMDAAATAAVAMDWQGTPRIGGPQVVHQRTSAQLKADQERAAAKAAARMTPTDGSGANALCSRLGSCCSGKAPPAPVAPLSPPRGPPRTISVSFELPYRQEEVFAALASVDDPLGFDTRQPGFAQQVLWHGTELGRPPSDASQVVYGCIRKASFAAPMAGSTTSELVDIAPPERLQWRQLHSEGALRFVGCEGRMPVNTMHLSPARRGGGTAVLLEFEFTTLQLPRTLCCLAPCATPLVGWFMTAHVARQWADGMRQRGATTVQDAAAATVQARARGGAVRTQQAEVRSQNAAAVVVQSHVRGQQVRTAPQKEEARAQNAAAVAVQAHVRGQQTRTKQTEAAPLQRLSGAAAACVSDLQTTMASLPFETAPGDMSPSMSPSVSPAMSPPRAARTAGEAGEPRTSRKAVVAVLGQMLERLEARRGARGQGGQSGQAGQGGYMGEGHKADRRRDELEEQALKERARKVVAAAQQEYLAAAAARDGEAAATPQQSDTPSPRRLGGWSPTPTRRHSSKKLIDKGRIASPRSDAGTPAGGTSL